MAFYKSKFKWLGFLGLALIVSGCGNTRELLGLERSAPDEFAVFSRAPLSMPPDFALRPPRPGTERPQEEAEREKVQRALFGRGREPEIQNTLSTPASPGLQALMEQTGALQADPTIRQQVDRETGAFIAENESFTDDLMFWKNKEAFGTKVDPNKEAQRIREAQALGEDVDGSGTVVIERKREAIFEGIFN